MYQRVVRLYRHFHQALFQHVIPILISLVVMALGIAFIGTYYLSQNVVNSQALRFAKVSAQTLNEARTLYSQNVVSRVKDMDNVMVGAEYHNVEGGIPNPATYTIELGELLSDPTHGMLFRLYSEYPFPNRQTSGGPQDAFEREAFVRLLSM